jgi:ankyrin repeat protein
VQKEIIKLLLDHGADRRAKDGNNRLPVHWAAANGNTELFPLLLHQKSDIDAKDQNGKTPLHYAIDGFRPNWNPYGKGKPSMVKFLLDQGAQKDAQDEDGRTPMHFAAWAGSEEIFDLLQDRGASLSIKDKNGFTAPYVLARWKKDQISRANETIWYSHRGEGGSGGIGGGNG